MNLADLLSAIPESLWGVVLGSLLAFGGTYVATRQQLRHDAEQRERERKMQLRRDVFLEAADGVAGNLEYFMKFANMDLPMSEIVPANSRPGWLNKLYTVASVESIEAFTVANAALGGAAFELLRQRLDVQNANGAIASTNHELESVKAKLDQIREVASTTKDVEPTAEVEQARKALLGHWEQLLQELTRLDDRLSELHDDRMRKQRMLLESAVARAAQYQHKRRKALVALRHELDLPIDENRLEEFAVKIDAEVLPKLGHLLDSIDADTGAPAA